MQAFMKQVQDSLEQNEKLNNESKQNLFFLVKKMYRKMTLPRQLLVERLKTVSLEEGSKFLDREAYHYNINENNIRFRIDKIGDHQNVLCQALLEMAIIKESGKGLDDQELYATKKGSLEIYANYLVGNDSEFGISEDEQIITNLMNILTENKILAATLKDDGVLLKTTLQEYDLTNINNFANYNAKSRQTHLSQLAEIEKLLIYCFFYCQSQEKVVQNQGDFFTSLVGNPNIMGKPENYLGLQEVKPYFYKLETYNIRNNSSNIVERLNADNIIEMPNDEKTRGAV